MTMGYKAVTGMIAAALALPALLAPAVASAAAPARGWTLIGSKTVNGRTDRDVIAVRGQQRFTRIKLCTVNRPIRLLDLDIRFANGGHQDVGTRAVLGRNACTRDIDLKGQRRDLATISITYARANHGFLPPLVRVYAR